jgi:hypothetical protein
MRIAEREHDRNDALSALFNMSADNHAQAAIRIDLAINGGAAIALLAFIGNLASKDKVVPEQLSLLAKPLWWFVFGVIASGIAVTFAYLKTYLHAASVHWRKKEYTYPYIVETSKAKSRRIAGQICHLIGFLSAVIGFAFFCYGMSEIAHTIAALH